MGTVFGKRSRGFAARSGVSALWLLAALLSLCAHAATNYDGIDSYEEYGKRIKAAQQISPLGDSIFGDHVSLYNGATTFEVTDFSIPGNSALPVAMGRRLVIQDHRKQPAGGDGLLGFGDWDLDVPYISGTFTQQNGWTMYPNGATDRCSDNTHWPDTSLPLGGATGQAPYADIWNGNQLHIPGGGDQELLANTQSKAPAHASDSTNIYKWVTTGHWKVSCVGSVTPLSFGGEGFVAVSPTGVKYTFNYAVTRQTSSYAWHYQNNVGPMNVARVRIFLLATHVEDRFGNWVNYNYSGDHLTGITTSSNDGRSITVNWSGDTINSVTSALGTWTYHYENASHTNKYGVTSTWTYLSSVTRPDGSQWTYAINSGALITDKNDWGEGNEPHPITHCQTTPVGNTGSFGYTVGTPSGATATYDFEYDRHTRDKVPLACINDPNPNHNYPQHVTRFFDNFSLKSKTISGPGLVTATWNYDYGDTAGSYYTASAPYGSSTTEPYIPPGSCSVCHVSKTVTVTGPVSVTRYIYGTSYANNEGQLLQTQTVDPLSGNVLNAVTNTYVSDTQAPNEPFPDIAGQDILPNFTSPMGNRVRPVASSQISQDGATFTTTTNSFDAFARATKRTESSSLGYSKTDTTVYGDDLNRWVLGLVKQTKTNSTVSSQTVYDSLDRPIQHSVFDRPPSTRTWRADGTLATVSDGKGNTTKLENWYRGLPRTVTFEDNATESATVNAAGWITALTDENGSVTTYSYDVMGRISHIYYPTGDDVPWNATTFAFGSAAADMGVPAGHWRQVIATGNERTRTVYDAFWRPLVIQHYDATDVSGTMTETVIHYDAAGRKIFRSYPITSVSNYATVNSGIHTYYDALGRVTQVKQDSELGSLPTTTQYLSGFQTKVTNPRGKSTLTSYKAFGEPDTSHPVGIAQPEGVTTTIDRDVFGKPLSIIRSGSYGGSQVSQPRSFVYDGNQLLCKRVEPETGATLYAYDGAGNLAWSAPGTSLTGPSCDRGSVTASQKVVRGYDVRNRVTSVSYAADGISNTLYGYAPDGAMVSATNMNGNDMVQTIYKYNHRRLLTSESLSVPGATTFGIVYDYDVNGHLANLTYPDGQGISFAPNVLGQPTQAGSYATDVKYYPDGKVHQFTYGNDIVHTMTESTRGLPEHVTGIFSSSTFQDTTYTYDGNGNVAAITDGLSVQGNVDMSYDGLDRLIAAASPMFAGSHQANFTYDPFDNLRSAGVGNGNQYTYYYDAANRLATMAGSQTLDFGYDTRGNETRRNSQIYTFDMANRLRSANGLETYLYDAAGRRVRKTNAVSGASTYFYYNKAGSLLYEWNPASMNASDYIHLGGTLVAKATKNLTPIPATPSSISVPASSDNGAATVSWSASLGTASYILQQQLDGDTWAQVYSGSATSKAFSGLGDGSYVYRVRACSANGCSGWRTSGTLTVALIPAAPSSISVPASSHNGAATVSWTSSSLASSYKLQRQFNGGSWSQVYSGGATSKAFSGLGDGSYKYRVQACDANGCSGWRTSGTLTVAWIPATPSSITVPSSSYSAAIGVSWGASAHAGNYVLEQSANGGSWGVVHSANVTSYTVTVAASGGYRFQVSACGAGGCSGFRTSGNVAVTLKPASAPSLSGPSTSASGTFTMSWSAVSGATKYQLNQSINGGAWHAVVNGTGRSWSSSSLGNGTYAYKAYGWNAAGWGPASNQVTVKVVHPPTAPGSVTAPTLATVNVAFGVHWSAVSGATSYQLRQTESGGRNKVTTVYSGSATSKTLTLTGLVDDDFRFAARACNSGGCSAWTNASRSTYLQRAGRPMAMPASGSTP